MSNQSEVSHAKNVANFFLLIQELKQFGASYNPSNSDLLIANLEMKHQTAESAQQTLNNALPTFNASTISRHDAFGSLNSMVTRSLGMLRASGTSAAKVKNAEQWARKLRGMSKSKAAVVASATATISTSQQSFDMKIDLFDKFLAELETEPKYAPNEVDLTTASLRNLYQTMDIANKAIKTAAPIVSAARDTRNTVLYNETDGLVLVAKQIKEYVKAVYGFNNTNYKKVSGIAFRVLSH